jgi:hypothetical protein
MERILLQQTESVATNIEIGTYESIQALFQFYRSLGALLYSGIEPNRIIIQNPIGAFKVDSGSIYLITNHNDNISSTLRLRMDPRSNLLYPDSVVRCIFFVNQNQLAEIMNMKTETAGFTGEQICINQEILNFLTASCQTTPSNGLIPLDFGYCDYTTTSLKLSDLRLNNLRNHHVDSNITLHYSRGKVIF